MNSRDDIPLLTLWNGETMRILAVLATAMILDWILGDPYWMPHPVRLMGKTIAGLEKGIRRIMPESEKGEFWGGVLLVFLMVLIFTGGSGLLLFLCYRIHWFLGFALESILCYQFLAARSLSLESRKVQDALEEGDVEKARTNVSMIVGRDTKPLDDVGIAKAAVETVAENTSDGVIAPLFYMVLGGAVLGAFYKAVNTMDSMVGYKNEKYLYFGRAAARLDDVVNFIPARISAIFMILAAFLMKGADARNAFRIFKRDRKKHASPNSAQTEAACAGALHIQLAGDAWYFGKLHKKPFIGDPDRPVEYQDISRAGGLMYRTEILVFAAGALVRLAILWGMGMV